MDEMVRRLREKAGAFDYDGRPDIACDYEQAADAIEELQADKAALNGTVSNLIQQIKELSKDLERSKEWETFWEKEANEALKKFQTAVASMPRWISVKERLPEIDPEHHCSKDVIVRVEGGGYMFSALEENIFGQAWFECERMSPSGDDGYTVTHWMPLPQAPKEET